MSILAVGINGPDYGGRLYICQHAQNREDEIEQLIIELKQGNSAGDLEKLEKIGNRKVLVALIEVLNQIYKNCEPENGWTLLNAHQADLMHQIIESILRIFPEIVKKKEMDVDAAVKLLAAEVLKDAAFKNIYSLEAEIAEMRVKAINFLGQKGDGRAAPVLIELLRESDGCLRSAACEALNQLDEQAIQPLALALQEDNLIVRMAALNSLTQIALKHDMQTKKQVLQIFKDRLGLGLENFPKEKNPLVLEAMRKAYNRIKESLKGE